MTIIRTAEQPGFFRVTYDTISTLSAECGSTQSCGWLNWQCTPVDGYIESQWDLQDIKEKLQGHIEGDGAKVPSFVSIDPGSEWWLDTTWSDIKRFATDPDDLIGLTLYLHRPGWITDSSWLRVLRMLGWRSVF